MRAIWEKDSVIMASTFNFSGNVSILGTHICINELSVFLSKN